MFSLMIKEITKTIQQSRQNTKAKEQKAMNVDTLDLNLKYLKTDLSKEQAGQKDDDYAVAFYSR